MNRRVRVVIYARCKCADAHFNALRVRRMNMDAPWLLCDLQDFLTRSIG